MDSLDVSDLSTGQQSLCINGLVWTGRFSLIESIAIQSTLKLSVIVIGGSLTSTQAGPVLVAIVQSMERLIWQHIPRNISRQVSKIFILIDLSRHIGLNHLSYPNVR
jgi:hypothetical protein